MYRDGYVESNLLSEDPVELVRLLYAKAIEKLRLGTARLEAGDVPAFTKALGHAMEIVGELQGSLNREQGGDIARALAELYGYVQRRLSEAVAEGRADSVREAVNLLDTLYEGWKECGARRAAATVKRPVDLGALEAGRVWTL